MAEESSRKENPYTPMYRIAGDMAVRSMEYCSRMFFSGIEVYNAWIEGSMRLTLHLMSHGDKSYQGWKRGLGEKKNADTGGTGAE